MKYKITWKQVILFLAIVFIGVLWRIYANKMNIKETLKATFTKEVGVEPVSITLVKDSPRHYTGVVVFDNDEELAIGVIDSGEYVFWSLDTIHYNRILEMYKNQPFVEQE